MTLHSPSNPCATLRAGIAVTCTCTPRTAMEAAPANPEGPCLALSSSPCKLQPNTVLTSLLSATTTPPPTTTPSANCSLTSMNCYFIPGRELTTFYGHANAFGTTLFIDYRVGTQQVPDANTMFRSAKSLGAIISINHPELPRGEICMGCGWTPSKPVDFSLVNSIEVVNGGGRPATQFWEQHFAKGYRLTAIGGSDNHHADWPPEKPGSIGYPTTVVYAQNLSVAAILDGVRSGRVFIDVTGSRNRLLDMSAQAGPVAANMGSNLEPHSGESIALEIHVIGGEGAALRFFLDGTPSSALPPLAVSSADQVLHARWQADGARHWIRVEVHDAQDRLILLGNPVYIGFDSQRSH